MPSAATVVTLVTGDRVSLSHTGDGLPVVTIDPASRSAGSGFQTLTIGGHVHVIPTDAAGYVGAPLDLGLFDITALAAAERGDPSASLALDVTRTDPAATLPCISSSGVEKHSDAATFCAASTPIGALETVEGRCVLFAGISRVALARSVPPGQPAGAALHVSPSRASTATARRRGGASASSTTSTTATRSSPVSRSSTARSRTAACRHYEITSLIATTSRRVRSRGRLRTRPR